MSKIKLFLFISLTISFFLFLQPNNEAKTLSNGDIVLYSNRINNSIINVDDNINVTQLKELVAPTPILVAQKPVGSSFNRTTNPNEVLVPNVIAYARSKVDAIQWPCLQTLWGGESGFIPGNVNPSSLAAGIPQSYPPTKLYPEFASMERVIYINKWGVKKSYLVKPDYEREVDWGISYISNRYKTPCQALKEWQSRSPHWY